MDPDQIMVVVWCLVALLVVISVGGVYLKIRDAAAAKAEQESRQVQLKYAEGQYRRSLKALQADPANTDLRVQALELGRKYARLSREGSETLFDELALKNDIDAVTGGR